MIAPISTYPFSLWERGAAIIAFAFLFLSVPAHAAEKVLDVQVIKSPAGIEAWLVEDHSVPVISVNFSFEGGLALDPANKPGVGRLVSILLDEGAGDLDSQGFQEKLSENAISLSFSSGRDDFTGQLKTLTAHQDTAFDLLTLALTKPRFDKDAITRMKNANTSGIKDDLGDPSWLVARTFNGMLFAGHNYARPGYGHLASMESITRKDLVDFTARQFTRNGLKVAIAGDITKDAAAAMLDLIFGALPEKPAPPLPQTGHTNLKHGGKIILLPIDTPQTYISAGSEGISHHDKDWHAAVVMNYILGGGAFDARLMKEIREKRGLTYGVYSNLSTMAHANVIQANLSAGNEKAAEAVRVLKEEWGKFAAKGATEQEIKDAKNYLTGSLLLQLTSSDDISGTLNSLQRDHLPPDYINERNAKINAVTAKDIHRVATRLLKPENLTIVLVGQPKGINADITLDEPPGMKTPKE